MRADGFWHHIQPCMLQIHVSQSLEAAEWCMWHVPLCGHLYSIEMPEPGFTATWIGEEKVSVKLCFVLAGPAPHHHNGWEPCLLPFLSLQVLGSLKSLTQLVLQGRMCSATDDGLLSLTGLTNLASLAISWVPWQSQISQVWGC